MHSVSPQARLGTHWAAQCELEIEVAELEALIAEHDVDALDLGLLGAKAADAMTPDDCHARQRLLEAQRERLDHRVHVGAVDTDLGGREVERRAWVITRER